jgi:hypothetical protein
VRILGSGGCIRGALGVGESGGGDFRESLIPVCRGRATKIYSRAVDGIELWGCFGMKYSCLKVFIRNESTQRGGGRKPERPYRNL